MGAVFRRPANLKVCDGFLPRAACEAAQTGLETKKTKTRLPRVALTGRPFYWNFARRE
jgi:hypothetical protein